MNKYVEYNLVNNIEQDINIKHPFDQYFDNKIFLRLFPYKSIDKSYDIVINLINS